MSCRLVTIMVGLEQFSPKPLFLYGSARVCCIFLICRVFFSATLEREEKCYYLLEFAPLTPHASHGFWRVRFSFFFGVSFLFCCHFLPYNISISQCLKKSYFSWSKSQKTVFTLLGHIMFILQLFLFFLTKVVLMNPFWKLVYIRIWVS